ncbi:hypothetical protein [Acinetobacter bereziniae]|uniref:hypothetical protein n=1 Tax=Acinetobacter bereziniae TaxID=106648 RepID=UPI0012500CC4|nr:hypothetical protein [Acinetobacter bereziniae]MBJ8553856.1 hypothetical protein [Acinetobacter bereziniae]MBJ9904118.1 hypothetical protein [Acinetobacter bereziniae]MCU4320081.1 hypothetical protein [Acinetobacter bereziniae]MCU4600650.1 hypothetical protein [Acinetobacter bereziniae]
MKITKIVLAMPSHSNFASPIQKNLKYHNFDIKFINSSPEHLKRIKLPFLNSLYSFFRKLFFSDSSYKLKAKQIIKHKTITQSIQTHLIDQKSDYTLVIRPDLFELEHLQLLKTHTSQFIGYQWNGLARFPTTLLSIPYFDRFFVFDNTDLSNADYNKYNLLGTTNFYFDMYQPQPIPHQGIIAYFVGLHFDERVISLDICAQELIKHGIKLDFNIRFLKRDPDNQAQYKCKDIKFIKKNIEFDDNLYHINQADILVDIVNPVHNGLSFRTFEALYYEKKLITNNKTVMDYDFYHPNNILIWDGKDLSMLKDFLSKPLVSIDIKIREKYGFKNWIRNLLDCHPYTEINLPHANPK